MKMERVQEGLTLRSAPSHEEIDGITVTTSEDVLRYVHEVQTDLEPNNANLIGLLGAKVCVALDHNSTPIARSWIWEAFDSHGKPTPFIDIAWGHPKGREAIMDWGKAHGFVTREMLAEPPDLYIKIPISKRTLEWELMHAPFMSTFKYLDVNSMTISALHTGVWQVALDSCNGLFALRTKDLPESYYDGDDIAYLIQLEIDAQSTVYRCHEPRCVCGFLLESSDGKEPGDKEWKYCPDCGRMLIWMGDFERTCSVCGDEVYGDCPYCEEGEGEL